VNWVATGANRYFYKYSDMVDSGNIQNTMIPMIRLGEMYLIAAESRAKDIAAGVGYVNQLRSHRGVGNLTALTRDILQYEYIRRTARLILRAWYIGSKCWLRNNAVHDDRYHCYSLHHFLNFFERSLSRRPFASSDPL
jgi:hypothetical protein